MTLDYRNKEIEIFFKGCLDILCKKGADYNPDNKAFKEVEATALDIDVKPEKVLWVHLRKHYTAIRSHICKGELESEPIEERLKDFVNYAALIYVYIKYKNKVRHPVRGIRICD